MEIVQDFTGLPEGATVPLEGIVSRCPLCGRNGVEERFEYASNLFVHAVASEMLGDGLRVEPRDTCPLVH